jgi:hypothetical protein
LEQQDGPLEQQDDPLEQQDGKLEQHEAPLVQLDTSVPEEGPVPVTGLAVGPSVTTDEPIGGVAPTGAITTTKATAQRKNRFFIRFLSQEIVAQPVQFHSIHRSFSTLICNRIDENGSTRIIGDPYFR